MAQKHTVQLVDDLDGTKAAETVCFSYDGAQFEIDLSARNARNFKRIFSGYAEHARTVGRHARPRRKSSVKAAAIRAWAKQQGIDIADHGRIPVLIQRRYAATR